MQDKNVAPNPHPSPAHAEAKRNPPLTEEDRLAALRRCGLLDTLPAAAFDRITALAARLFAVPAAAVSLVDERRIWFKSRGGPVGALLPPEMERGAAPCPYALLSPHVLVIEDARQDPRFQDTPLVAGPPGVRFYAGAPLCLPDGAALGTLCLLDFAPRRFSDEQQATLQELAAGVVREIKLRRTLIAGRESEALHRQMFAANPYPMWLFDAETLAFLEVNDAASRLYGFSRAEFLQRTILDIRPAEDRAFTRRHLKALKTRGGSGGKRGLWRHQAKNGRLLWVEVSSHSVRFENRDARMAIIQDVTERCRAESALRRSEQKFAMHVQQMPLGAIEMAPDMTVTRWNPAAERLFGYTAEEAMGRSTVDLIVPEKERAHVEEVRAGILTGSGGRRSTNYNRTKSGELLLCDWYNTPLFDDAGHPIGCASLVRDITDEAEAQTRLRRSESHKAAILSSALDCIISIDHLGNVTDWNPAAERTFGYAQTEAIGRPITALILPPPLRPAYQRGLLLYLQRGNWPALRRRIELPVQRRNGAEFFAEVTAAPLDIEPEPLYTLYLRDITERRGMEREREELLARTEALLADALTRADHDPLTGLLNHRAFHKRLKEEVDAGHAEPEHGGAKRRGALLLIDLDNFKFFNDAYGHLAGDDVLRRVSRAFERACRPGDVLARFGGDEFALLLPGADSPAAQAVADALRRAVAEVGYQPQSDGAAIPFTLSLGAACCPDDGLTPAALLEAADARLRVAKSGGDADSHALRVRRSLAQSVGGFTMLDALVTAVDNKDRYTRRHSEDVMHYSRQLAAALGLSRDVQRTMEVAALLHDVGKIGVPDAVLRKPGRLCDDEYAAIKQHPLMGSVIVGAVPGFEDTLDAVRHHHERWDGDGYPFGLRGAETPLPARIMAVADAYSAMTTDRPYRKGMAPAKALAILEDGAGTQWDPVCVQAFLAARRSGTVPAEDTPMTDDEMDTAAKTAEDTAETNGAMDDLPDGDRQLVTDSAALDEGGTNDSDLGADVAGDIGPKHE